MSTFIETEAIKSASDYKVPNINTTVPQNSDINILFFFTFYRRLAWIEFNIDMTGPHPTAGMAVYYKRENGTEFYILNESGDISTFPDMSKVVPLPDNFIVMPNDEVRFWTSSFIGNYNFTGFNRTLSLTYDFF